MSFHVSREAGCQVTQCGCLQREDGKRVRSAISQICLGAVQLPMSAVNMTLAVFAAERRAAAPCCGAAAAERRLHVARCTSSCRRSAANPPHAAAAVDRLERRTDGRSTQFLRHSRTLCGQCRPQLKAWIELCTVRSGDVNGQRCFWRGTASRKSLTPVLEHDCLRKTTVSGHDRPVEVAANQSGRERAAFSQVMSSQGRLIYPLATYRRNSPSFTFFPISSFPLLSPPFP